MEVSSHALALDRLYGVHMDGAVFTNLTRDHLDFHGTLAEYGQAKMILFEKLCDAAAQVVVNLDDPFGREIVRVTPARVLTYGMQSPADIRPVKTELSDQGSHLVLATPAGTFDLSMRLLGEFNVYNTMAALGVGIAFAVDRNSICAGLESVAGVRGRFESVTDRRGVTVVIDYAHTPDALEKILVNARRLCRGKLVAVFGCGGDRDRGKRPIMGNCATHLADQVYITSDNPRTEEPSTIIAEILRGIPDQKNYTVVVDRKQAIAQALTAAAPRDMVVIAGKGHEDYQIIGTQKFHFDDLEIVKNILHLE
jgi:UDP-N-acetylmuramoyl-L-alanyl-D-glutamate--2,6-diaminopimelate ligase